MQIDGADYIDDISNWPTAVSMLLEDQKPHVVESRVGEVFGEPPNSFTLEWWVDGKRVGPSKRVRVRKVA